MYLGQKNTTYADRLPCLKWSEVDHEYVNSSILGDHNFCRKPYHVGEFDDVDEIYREWCFTTDGRQACQTTSSDLYISVKGFKKEVKKTIYPTKTVYRKQWGKCASFEVSESFESILIKSPVTLNVNLHGQNQFYSVELVASLQLVSYHEFEVTVSKTMDLFHPGQPCYEGRTYDQSLFILNLMFR